MAISATKARPNQTQSKPSRPDGATITYIRVVHGTNTNPRAGQMKRSNVAFQIAWSASHQMRIPARGPRNARIKKTQHMMTSFCPAQSESITSQPSHRPMRNGPSYKTSGVVLSPAKRRRCAVSWDVVSRDRLGLTSGGHQSSPGERGPWAYVE